ncbi:STY0301 family protein [Burkholderia semiarida]|uniref:STY0301 family protein n=1 Tax=Burkholderia semiarida TaxID=2843303 RepID=UPI0038784432
MQGQGQKWPLHRSEQQCRCIFGGEMMMFGRQTPYRLLTITAFAFSSLTALPVSAATSDCPARIAVTQQLDGQPPDGWKNFDTQRTYPLAGVTSLAEAREDYWVSCDYGNTSVVIARPLGKHAQTCVARYKRGHAIVQTWQCTPRK